MHMQLGFIPTPFFLWIKKNTLLPPIVIVCPAYLLYWVFLNTWKIKTRFHVVFIYIAILA